MDLYNKIIKKLIKRNVSVSVVESCTGGLLSKLFISHPGISKIFNFGLITYSNKSKENILKINKQKIKQFGAVSREISILMVKNLYKLSSNELCISTTGIAGPTGGTKLKPVGLVYISIMYDKKIITIKNIFTGSRKDIQKKTINKIFLEIEKLI